MAERTSTGLNLPPLKIVGTVIKSSFTEKFATPRQGPLNPTSFAEIELSKSFSQDFFEGLQEFSHCWILWWFHLNEGEAVKAKVFAPRKEGQKTGVFATRSPHRPNPIGLSCVKLVTIAGRVLTVEGVDFVQGTPIIDVKPFIREDLVAGPQFGWTEQVKAKPIEIIWEVDLEQRLDSLTLRAREALVATVEASLRLDPRPLIYRKLEVTQGYQGPFGAKINGYNVVFLSKEGVFKVVDLQLLDET